MHYIKNKKTRFFLLTLLLFFARGLSAFEMQNISFYDSLADRILYFSTTKEPSGALKPSLLKDLRDFFGLKIFIESGTNFGNTSANAAQIFQKVYTVEIFPEFYANAQIRFKNHTNVFLLLGDSGVIFRDLIPEQREEGILFYLDGHFDGGKSGKGTLNTPIIRELDAIQAGGHFTSVILIDDICDFQASFYPDRIANTCFEGYPDLKELVEKILKINPSYQICFLGNALLAFPPTPGVSLSQVNSACAIDRLSTITHLFSNDLLFEMEHVIAAATGQEKEELIHYYHQYSNFEWNYGWRSFSSLWYALILRFEGQEKQGRKLLKTTAQNSLPGWRVNYY